MRPLLGFFTENSLSTIEQQHSSIVLMLQLSIIDFFIDVLLVGSKILVLSCKIYLIKKGAINKYLCI